MMNQKMVYINGEPPKNRPQDKFYAFTWLANSSKRKVIKSNKDLFLVSGQNALIAFIIFTLYMVTWIGQLGKRKNKIVKIYILI